ncbi:MAG: HPF/RaiA family ribosome-associated protein [Patescibacteria group bacterium]|nr:HPF/RaiA family ribosome-associated protein [Patescibacteria group bacterium]
MNVEYYHKNIDPLSNATREYIEEKLESIGKLTEIRDARVEVSQRKDGEFYLNVSLRSVNGEEYRAEEKSESIQANIDIIQEEIKRQVRSDTERSRDLTRRGGRSIKKKMTVDESARF